MNSTPKSNAAKAAAQIRANRANREEAMAQSAIRTDPIRITVDLDPDLWGELGEFVARAGRDLRRKVTQMDVMRLLITLLTDEESGPQLQAQIVDQLRQ